MTDLPDDDGEVIVFDTNALLGVISPPTDDDDLPEMRPFDLTVMAVSAGVTQVREQLKIKRAARDELQAEIRQLVAEERLLSRLERVSKEALKLDD